MSKQYEVRWLLNADPPKDKPMRVQMEALAHSYPKEGWGHILDMGLGKTAVALNEFCMAAEDANFTRMLVVAPNNFKGDWKIEAEEFRFPYSFIVLDANNRDAVKRQLRKDTEKTLAMAVNFEALAYPATMEVIKLFCGAHRTYLAIDESVKIKNPNSGFFRNVSVLSGMATMVRILSGKPVVQGPHDLWAQLRVLGALSGFNYFAFRNRYCLMGGFKGKEVIGYKNEEEIKNYLKNWMFTANARDYSDRPLPTYTLREVPLSDRQRELYNDMERDFMVDLGNNKFITAPMVITRYSKLQQITSGFVYDENSAPTWLVEPGENHRVKAIIEMMDEEIQGKAIVGVHHSATLEMLMEGLAKYNPVFIRGLSHMTKEEQTENKRRFNKDHSCRIILGQLEATKYGHTLIGDQEEMPCFHTMFYENVFSLDTRAQFERRNDRTGQKYGNINTDFYSSPMDLRVVKALQRKENVSSAIIGYAREKGILTGDIP